MSRINVNGKPPVVKPSAPRKVKTDNLHKDCRQLILGTIAASVGLNAFAGWSHGGIAGALVMALIPIAILKISEIASKLGKRTSKADRFKAKVGAGIGLALLALSLWHVSEAIAALTGAQAWQSWALAIGIDAGLVWAEWTKTTAKD